MKKINFEFIKHTVAPKILNQRLNEKLDTRASQQESIKGESKGGSFKTKRGVKKKNVNQRSKEETLLSQFGDLNRDLIYDIDIGGKDLN